MDKENNSAVEQVIANHHISVDCVVLGFDSSQLNVLLIKREGVEEGQVFHDMKLPGSLIYKDEDLDGAAKRVLFELTGLKNVNLTQFKAFGAKNRTKDPKDKHWLERATKEQIDSIITVAYVSLVKINGSIVRSLDKNTTAWVPITHVPRLAFDHNVIIKDALDCVRQHVRSNPTLMFELLPRKFTASQLRVLYEILYEKRIDVRNFHKKMAMMTFLVPLDEYETGVAHRAARYYKFDKEKYNKGRF